MQRGLTYKRAIPGTDAERYCAQLFRMKLNDNGSRRPDLTTVNGMYLPNFSLEVKSGIAGGVLVDYQLHYGLTVDTDYNPFANGFLPGISWDELVQRREKQEAKLYYNQIARADRLRSNDLVGPFSAIKLTWADQHIVPSDFIFTYFAIRRMLRTGETYANIESELRQTIIDDVLGNTNPYHRRKGRSDSWQDLSGTDIRALVEDEYSKLRKPGMQRIQLLKKHYDLSSLTPLQIPGPNNTLIHILAKNNDLSLFEQVERTIKEQTPKIEKVTKERKKILPALKKVRRVNNLYENGDLPEEMWETEPDLTHKEISKLNRLSRWLAPNESDYEEDIIPF